MATIYVTGEARWAKVQTPDAKYKYYGLELLPDSESLKTLQESGITTVKPREDGYWSFKRRPEQIIWSNREQVKAGPPAVVDSEGNPSKELIGNGSRVQVRLEVFPYNNTFGTGVSCRLEAVKILDLVRFERTETTEPKLRIMF